MKDDNEYIVSQTVELWSEIRNSTIFITGGTGFIGAWLLQSFAWANETLDLHATALVLTRDQTSFALKAPHLYNNPSIRFLDGDIVSFDFPQGTYSHIIHAATETSHDLFDNDSIMAFDNIVSGMKRVSEFAVSANARKLLLISSGAIYGKQLPHLPNISEDDPGAPNLFSAYSSYAEGKRVAEMIGGIYSKKHGFEFKIARCFSIYGPYMKLDQHFAIGNFIRDALQGGPIVVNGDGSPYRSYMYASDMAIWLWTILFYGKSCYPYNVGSDLAIQIEDLAGIVSMEVLGYSDVAIRNIPDASRPADRYVPGIRRAQEELGLCVGITLAEGIQRTVRSITNHV